MDHQQVLSPRLTPLTALPAHVWITLRFDVVNALLFLLLGGATVVITSLSTLRACQHGFNTVDSAHCNVRPNVV